MPAGTSIANAIIAKVGADLTGFQSGMREARGVAKKAGQKIAKAFAVGVATIAAVGTAAAVLGKKIFDVGASVLETRSKFETVFGAATLEVEKFADRLAPLAGLSQSQAQGVLASTGAMVQGMGFAQQASADFAQQVLKLAGDIGSFNDLPTAEVARAIQSAMVGEREALKRFDITVREADVQQRAMLQTGKDSVKALTDQEKATATLALITERAGVAVGDMARTQGSAARQGVKLSSQIQTIKEQLSVAFLPVITENVLPVIEDLIQKIKENQVAIVRLGAGFVEVAKVIVTTVSGAFVIAGAYIGNFAALLKGVLTRDWELIKAAVTAMKESIVTNVSEIFNVWAALPEKVAAAMDAAGARAYGATESAVERQLRLLKQLKPEIVDIPRELSLKLPEVLPKIQANIVAPLYTAKSAASGLNDEVLSVGTTITSQVGTGITDVVMGFRNAAEAAKDLGKAIMREIVHALVVAIAKAIILKTVMKAFGLPFEKGGMIPKAQRGMMLPPAAPAGGIPILAHPGEAVLTRDAVRRIGGPPAVASLNRPGGTEVAAPSTHIEHLSLSFPGITDTASLKRELPGILTDLRRTRRI